MTDHTPGEPELRDAYILTMRIVNEMRGRADDAARSGEEFDRGIARIKAAAWDAGYEGAARYHGLDTEHAAPSPHRRDDDD